MKLYHGGTAPVAEPDLSRSRQRLDFGGGFYTTTSLAQAVRWSKIKCKREELLTGCVSCYEFDEDVLKSKTLAVHRFKGPSRAWLTFVIRNRRDDGYSHPYDVVQGAVANDRVYTCINAFESGFIDFDAVINRLRTYALVDQLSFHTERAVKHLRFIGERRVRLSEADS